MNHFKSLYRKVRTLLQMTRQEFFANREATLYLFVGVMLFSQAIMLNEIIGFGGGELALVIMDTIPSLWAFLFVAAICFTAIALYFFTKTRSIKSFIPRLLAVGAFALLLMLLSIAVASMIGVLEASTAQGGIIFTPIAFMLGFALIVLSVGYSISILARLVARGDFGLAVPTKVFLISIFLTAVLSCTNFAVFSYGVEVFFLDFINLALSGWFLVFAATASVLVFLIVLAAYRVCASKVGYVELPERGTQENRMPFWATIFLSFILLAPAVTLTIGFTERNFYYQTRAIWEFRDPVRQIVKPEVIASPAVLNKVAGEYRVRQAFIAMYEADGAVFFGDIEEWGTIGEIVPLGYEFNLDMTFAIDEEGVDSIWSTGSFVAEQINIDEIAANRRARMYQIDGDVDYELFRIVLTFEDAINQGEIREGHQFSWDELFMARSEDKIFIHSPSLGSSHIVEQVR